MNIALMANDKKKELMVQFCTAYRSILAQHNVSATATTIPSVIGINAKTIRMAISIGNSLFFMGKPPNKSYY